MGKKLKKSAGSAGTSEDKAVDIMNKNFFSGGNILSKKEAKIMRKHPIRPFAEGVKVGELACNVLTSPSRSYKLTDVLSDIRREIKLLTSNRSNTIDIKDMDQDTIRLKAFYGECDGIECIFTTDNDGNIESQLKELCDFSDDEKIGYAVWRAYELGGEVMKERLREHIGRPTGMETLGDPIYWGKKIDDYFNKCEKQNKTAITFAYMQVRIDWKKEIRDLSTNPVPGKDTLKKYWNMYLKQNK